MADYPHQITSKMSLIKGLVLLQLILAPVVLCDQSSNEIRDKNKLLKSNLEQSTGSAPIQDATNQSLEPRFSDRGFIKDILDRLHALDADIGKLVYNSTTSMYSPNDPSQAFTENSKGGEKFTEVLNDLDSLQDEIGVLINNATRTRQYNILVRLRPLNGILYRIRHNLHLMRNSLVAINTVSSLEKIGNSVLDSTLQAFMKPDANLSDEIGDNGNYDLNLDRLEDLNSTTISVAVTTPSTTTTTLSTTPSTTTTTTKTTKPPPPPSSTSSVPVSTSTTKRPNQRGNMRRNQRRTTQKPSTPKPTTAI